jgi:signal-induced proliferation-associated 1 like protein 3
VPPLVPEPEVPLPLVPDEPDEPDVPDEPEEPDVPEEPELPEVPELPEEPELPEPLMPEPLPLEPLVPPEPLIPAPPVLPEPLMPEPLLPLEPLVPELPLVPLVPLVPLAPEPLVPPMLPLPVVPLLPLMPLLPLLPLLPLMPLLLPLLPDWLLSDEDEECFLLFFFLECLVPLVDELPLLWSPACMPLAPLCWLPAPMLWSDELWPEVLLDWACAFSDANIAATTETPSNPFNTLLIFMSISLIVSGQKPQQYQADTIEDAEFKAADTKQARGSLPEKSRTKPTRRRIFRQRTERRQRFKSTSCTRTHSRQRPAGQSSPGCG